MKKKSDSVKINTGTKEELEIKGFKRNAKKTVATVFLSIISGGLLLIPLSWRSSVKLFFMFDQCALKEATNIFVKDIYGQEFEELVEEENYENEVEEILEEDINEKTKLKSNSKCRKFFTNKRIKYVWDDIAFNFERIKYINEGTTMLNLHQRIDGLTSTKVKAQRQLFGENFIHIEVASVWKLLINQLIIFVLIVCVCGRRYLTEFLLNGTFNHLPYFILVFLIYVCVSVILINNFRLQSRALRERMTSQSTMKVLRDGKTYNISSSELVPGDIVMIGNQKSVIEVDAVLLQGTAITNEAMLTGESVPITKVELPQDNNETFIKDDYKQHILFSGTELLQIRGTSSELPALVINTGFDTARGELVRSILFPKPMDFHIYTDFLKLILLFFILGLFAMGWSFYIWSSNQASMAETFLNSMDLITFVIPPILPATITAINVWAQRRLKSQKIFCLSSNYISLAGPVDVVCFDKTGTLTENDLSIAGALPSNQENEFIDPVDSLADIAIDSDFIRSLATCHSLVIADGNLIGHPLDMKIFEALNWDLHESTFNGSNEKADMRAVIVRPKETGKISAEDLDIAILKTFPFESKELRMTVITKSKAKNNFDVFIKGAPEMIASLCKSNTVPQEFEQVLAWYTSQGLRVVATASKSFDQGYTWAQIEEKSRDELEQGANFLGLVLLQNSLKPQTVQALNRLHSANINSIMITGDNLLTATSVAKQSGLVGLGQQIVFVHAEYVKATDLAVQHLKVHFYDANNSVEFYDKKQTMPILTDSYVLATEGKSFDLIYKYDTNLYKKLIHKGKIFARMKPDQKILVIEELQNLGHQVAMCGDGCNDCGALKAAHAGISLSTTEASVAAPFTSQDPNIDCVANLILEGRSTLVSIYASFKYNISYCFAALICVLIHYTILTEPSDMQYIIMDLVLVTVPSLVLGNTGAPKILVKERPSKRILSPTHILSILSFLTIQAIFYTLIWTITRMQSWFEPYVFISGLFPPAACYENTYLVIFAFYSFVIGAIVFSHGYPHRLPFYTNKILTAYFILATALCIFMNFYTDEKFNYFMNFKTSPSTAFSALVFFGAILNFAVCMIWERWLLYGIFEKKLIPCIKNRYGPYPPYITLEKEIKNDKQFPKLENIPSMKTMQTDDEPGSADSGVALTNYKNEISFNDQEDTPGLIRKLSMKYRFNASVRYKNEVQEPESRKANPSINVSPIYDQPIDLRFNQSVRGQILKGTSKGLTSFTGNKTKNDQLALEKNDYGVEMETIEPVYIEPLKNELYSKQNEETKNESEDINEISYIDENEGSLNENA